MRYLLLLASVSLLTACAIDPKQREARETAHIRELARVCEKVGFAAGSEQNKECVVKLLAAEIAQPNVIHTPYPSMPPMCYMVGSRLVCPPY